jgi:hypothetical protein
MLSPLLSEISVSAPDAADWSQARQHIGAIHERERPEIDMVLSRLENRNRIGARAGFRRETNWSALTPPVNVSA